MNDYFVYMATAARWIVGAVLLVAGIAKLQSPKAFATTVVGYGVLPSFVIRPVTLVLPLIEALLGLALLAGVGTRMAGAISAALFMVFGSAVAWNLARGNRVPCGCFGASKSEIIGAGTLLRDAALLLLSVGVALFVTPYLTLEGLWRVRSPQLPPATNGIPLALLSAAALGVSTVIETALNLGKVGA